MRIHVAFLAAAARHELGIPQESHDVLRWTSGSSMVSGPAVFSKHFFDDDNILFLYATQRVLLKPHVDEQVILRGGLQHVDITWSFGGRVHTGSGSARNKRAARREAAKRVLNQIPMSEEAERQMRKQMVNGLRMRLGGEVVADAPSASAVRTEYAHQIVWRVTKGKRNSALQVTAAGSGLSPAEAQARALEDLYVKASDPQLLSLAVASAQQCKENTLRAGVRDAEVGRQTQINERLSVLTSEAASDLAVRHNTFTQRDRIEARDDVVGHQAGFHCTLTWRWRGSSGPEERIMTGLGTSKRTARGDAIFSMLTSEGYMEDISPHALNQAARLRALAKSGAASAVEVVTREAKTFIAAQPPAAWSLALPDCWQLLLSRGGDEDAGGALEDLGASLASRLGLGSGGLPAELWESLLDACAHVASGVVARKGLQACERLPLADSGFLSPAHNAYFSHFRRLIAWERVGLNQTAVQEILDSGSKKGVAMDREQCVHPYLTLTPHDRDSSEPIFLDFRMGDVVLLQASAESGQVSSSHLAIVTSVVSPKPREQADVQGKVTLKCSTLSNLDVNAATFVVHGLQSEVTSLRMIGALRALTRPSLRKDETGAHADANFTAEMRDILVGSFDSSGVSIAQSLAGESSSSVLSASRRNEQCLEATVDAAALQGTSMTLAQIDAVKNAMDRRLTLIHGPPGTGKTTAAVCVVHAWRFSGKKILCVADSNVAADNLYEGLMRWDIKALRFSLADTPESGAENKGRGHSKSRRSRHGQQSSHNHLEAAHERVQEMRRAVADCQIVVATCIGSGHELLKGITFPCVLVDESTQAVEPASLVPLSHGCDHLVLIGDHRQLPPTVIAKEAQDGGLDRSLFARLAEGGEPVQRPGLPAVVEPLLLNEQRRMHPSIAAFPNMHFYSGRIQDAAPDRPPVPGVDWPAGGDVRVLLVDVPAAEERQGTSWWNATEVKVVLDFVESVLSSRGAFPVVPEEVSIITPYAQQRHELITELLQRSAGAPHGSARAKLRQVRVATVDGFQGAECDLVIFSAVRANTGGRLGFLQDERRANVLLTRARRGLVVFADASTLRRAAGTVWGRWMKWADELGAVTTFEAFKACLSPAGDSAAAKPPLPPLEPANRLDARAFLDAKS